MSGRRRRLALFGATVALLPAAAIAIYVAQRAPVVAPTRVDPSTTAAIPTNNAVLADQDRPAEDAGALKRGLDALATGDIATARNVRDGFLAQALDRHVLAWAIALRGGRLVPASDIAEAALELPSWPGMAALRRNAEQALLRENPSPKTVIDALGAMPPQTAAGLTILARAHLALGDSDGARAVLVPFWRTEKLDAGDEQAIIQEFGALIPAADHRFRMERMLYSERVKSAKRVSGLAGAEALADAWSAAITGDKAAMKLLDAVPVDQRSAGYLFAQARYLRKAQKYHQAAAAMLMAPPDKALLVDPDAWWTERRVLSRELVDLGDMKTAYAIVAAHGAESPESAADAEFHAGWYALRGLADPGTASRHFARIAEIARGPMSLSRAYYWMGRAAEAGGPGDSKAYFQRAATYGTSFYGQLSAQRIGQSAIPLGDPQPSDADRRNFANREAVAAITRLEAAGYPTLADTLYRDLATQIDSAGELALLAAMAERRDNHFLALKVGKIAASRGINIGALSHPVGVIPASADISGSGKALAYAIARQESEFNVSAVSGAGARGLLQLLPATAKEVAKRAGIDYSQARLTTDAGYNATLGAAFLGEQLARFDGSYVLTFAGYNAGPRRAKEWIRRYGDPRGKDIDTVVDWIERIPYSETRSYVQRVMENYQVYKMRLSGRFDIAGDLVNGR